MLKDMLTWKNYKNLLEGQVYDLPEEDADFLLAYGYADLAESGGGAVASSWPGQLSESPPSTPGREGGAGESGVGGAEAVTRAPGILGEAEGKSPRLAGKEARPPAKSIEKLIALTDYHLVEVYGPYGSGKSRLVHALAVEAQKAGYRVLYIDTEGGLADSHVRQLQNYWYVGDEVDALEDAVRRTCEQRDKYDVLVVDSVGHPVYVNYVELEGMQEKLRAYQRLALVFRDMVRFARGERGKDLGQRKALAVATNHPVSEFSRISKELPEEEPLSPFGGQIHRVPKLILRSEAVGNGRFRLLVYKARNLPKDFEVARFQVTPEGVRVEWKV